jgi:hypothetical protein
MSWRTDLENGTTLLARTASDSRVAPGAVGGEVESAST